MTAINATPACIQNMREHYEPGVFAVSVNNPDERYSANPADYWGLSDTDSIKDSGGEVMVLGREVTTIIDAGTGERIYDLA